MSLPPEDGLLLIAEAKKQTRRADIFQQWVVQLPWMGDSFISFSDYYDRVTGKGLDLRPTSVILEELDDIEALFSKE